ncbi:MAG: glutathione peroxidase [Flavobacteriales bacterium]|nr:glutathione peroxidase [Flavobacteriales bacterium]|tara:strand:+ start:4517 stop:5041 length:525 start_codon:yes stop_codon:yes gene_type:complete
MKNILIYFITLFAMTLHSQNNIYDIALTDIENNPINLNNFKGKYLLFVNVASYCGYTNQYSDLQKLHEKYDELEVIGLPCNQFLFQEPFSEDSIKEFCSTNYGINFTMTNKINVKGSSQHELYKWLTDKALNGVKNSSVKWNFQKYLVGKNGEFIDVFYSKTLPLSQEIIQHIN